MLYSIFKCLHILSAIVALGSNITYGFWLSSASRAPQSLVFTLKTIKALDNRLANRAYGVLFLTGIIMIYLGRWALASFWLITALVLYFGVALLGVFIFAPTLRKQINLAETSGPESSEYQAVARRATTLGILTISIVVIIVFLMVAKPHLWG